MDRVIAADSVNFAGRDIAPLTGTPQYFTSGNPGGGVPATVLPGYQMNAIQEEILAVINAAGIAFDRTSNAQLLAALQGLGSFSFGPSGRFRIPGTPALVQWTSGTSAAPAAASDLFTGGYRADVSFSWPVTFPNTCRFAWAALDLAPNQNCSFGLIQRSAGGGNLYISSGQNLNGIPYVAVGIGH